MKQVININFNGRIIPIEVTAYDMLKKYIASLNNYFANEEGKEEIVNDIENRIAELFEEHIKKGSTCITDDTVQGITKNMGMPEDFEATFAKEEKNNNQQNTDNSNNSNNANTFNYTNTRKGLFRDENKKILGGVCAGVANYLNIEAWIVRLIFIFSGIGFFAYIALWIFVPSSSSIEVGAFRKKLYRDEDNKILGGVCAGLSNYFGVQIWVPRLIFVLPFVTKFFDLFDGGLHSFRYSPGAAMVYIIAWLVVPPAKTTSEKLEAKGEKVDIDSIKNSVMEELKGVQQRATKIGEDATKAATSFSKSLYEEVNGTRGKAATNAVGNGINLLLKIIAYTFLGTIALSVIIALFALGITAVAAFPAKDFLIRDGWQNAYAWGTLLFFIATPIVGAITWIIRRLTKMKAGSKLITATFISLNVVGWVCAIALAASLTKDFKNRNYAEEQTVLLNNPAINKLEVKVPINNLNSKRALISEFSDLADLEDTTLIENVYVRILQAPNDSFKVTIAKLANGPDRRAAANLAEKIDYTVTQADSVLFADDATTINKIDKFRNQSIVLSVYVPIGKRIKIARNFDRFNKWTLRGPFEYKNDYNYDFDNNSFGFNTGVEYVMQKDGLYTLTGQKSGVSSNNYFNNELQNDYEFEKIDIDENGIKIERNNRNNDNNGNNDNDYRYDNRFTPQPNQQLTDSTIKSNNNQRIKDSLLKIKADADKQLKQFSMRGKAVNNPASQGFLGILLPHVLHF
jgi:phage shock protein PspC (stress-responsive transcriptional regulator)